jgi:hypothetical protein
MTDNPLTVVGGYAARITREDLDQWCATQNHHPLTAKNGWWYVVKRTDGSWYVDKLEGWRAEEARSHARGERTNWYRGTSEDMAACHAFARKCLDQGMTQFEFNDLVQRTGGCPVVQREG